MITIKTYQDLERVKQGAPEALEEFVLTAVTEHQNSNDFETAVDAELYYKHRNPTISRYQQFVTNVLGSKVPAKWKPNNKIFSNWFYYFVTQAVQYLLGNGVQFNKPDTKKKLGKDFDRKVKDLARKAKEGGVSFGFWNMDHIEVMGLSEFVPLYDEENGALRAGVRFWQLDADKPMRFTLYEEDGYTDFVKKDSMVKLLNSEKGKTPYKQKYTKSIAEGEKIYEGENYPSFPIVPFYNINRQSDLVGLRNTIDAYDLMSSGLINNVSEGDFIFWILKNCGGMTQEDDEAFLEQVLTSHVAHVGGDNDDEPGISTEKVEAAFAGSQAALAQLKEQLYTDAMALNVEIIKAGNVTATQIKSAYEPINEKTDDFEYCANDFVNGILKLAGIDDEPSYVRSIIANQSEDVQTLLSASEYLDDEFVVRRLCALLGCPDDADAILKRRDAEASDRFKTLFKNTDPENKDDEEDEE